MLLKVPTGTSLFAMGTTTVLPSEFLYFACEPLKNII